MSSDEETVGQSVVRVVRAAAEKAGREPQTVTLSTHLVEDLALSSLELIELALDIEEELEVDIDDDLRWSTVRELVSHVAAKLERS